jgi:hypothetical protein
MGGSISVFSSLLLKFLCVYLHLAFVSFDVERYERSVFPIAPLGVESVRDMALLWVYQTFMIWYPFLLDFTKGP